MFRLIRRYFSTKNIPITTVIKGYEEEYKPNRDFNEEQLKKCKNENLCNNNEKNERNDKMFDSKELSE